MIRANVEVSKNGVRMFSAKNAQTDSAFKWFLARAAKSGGTSLGSWDTFVCDVYTGGATGPSSSPPAHSSYTERKLQLTATPTSGTGVRWVFNNTATESYTPTRFSLYPREKTVDGTNVIGWYEPQAGATPVGRVLAGDTLTITWEITAAINSQIEADATFAEGGGTATALLDAATQLAGIKQVFNNLNRSTLTQPFREFKLELFGVRRGASRFDDFTNLSRLTYGGSNNDGVLTAAPSSVREVASGTEVDRVQVRFNIPLPAAAGTVYVYRFGTSRNALQTGAWRRLRARTSPTDTEPVIFTLTGYK